jgi:hypothetical protein
MLKEVRKGVEPWLHLIALPMSVCQYLHPVWQPQNCKCIFTDNADGFLDAKNACKAFQEITVAGCLPACHAQDSKAKGGTAQESNSRKRMVVQRIEVGPGVCRVEGLPACAADEVGGDLSPVRL